MTFTSYNTQNLFQNESKLSLQSKIIKLLEDNIQNHCNIWVREVVLCMGIKSSNKKYDKFNVLKIKITVPWNILRK